MLRVSGSLAKLLHPAGEERDQARDVYRDIYHLRSNIVHANNFNDTPQQIQQKGRLAVNAALDAIKVLLVDRPELLPLKSSERSLRILLDDGPPSGLDDGALPR
ncbi:hypothetical protein [Sinosporangium siamense]|uniref:Apea-like HEPN domain-containing protein n=1 Tax=Sinosporangium siamense TaxID=1367973 RepID=A0A919RIZ3_9ACTN|nr:hypothetical protein [Sinosporangium siamense]GII94731.1 hypothetical protein Ssi02_49620 [Sinosporangium siamense]